MLSLKRATWRTSFTNHKPLLGKLNLGMDFVRCPNGCLFVTVCKMFCRCRDYHSQSRSSCNPQGTARIPLRLCGVDSDINNFCPKRMEGVRRLVGSDIYLALTLERGAHGTNPQVISCILIHIDYFGLRLLQKKPG
jgi:hypothetical protein